LLIRRALLTRRAFLTATAAAACLPRAAAAKPALILNAADVHVDGYPTVEAVRFIGRTLERETNGRIGVRVYHSGQLGRESDTVDLVRYDVLQLTRVFFGALNNTFPLTGTFGLPYVFETTEHMRRAVDGPIGAEVRASFENRGLVGLAIYDSGVRCFYNTIRPVRVPGDLAGLKLRVPPSDLFIGLVRALGGNPTPLPYGEVFSALQTRLIDGAENNIRSFHSSRQFEVARHWSLTNHSYAPEALLMSRRRFDALSSADRALLTDAADESVRYMRPLWDQSVMNADAAIRAAGVQVNDADRGAFRAAAKPQLERYLRDPDVARLHAAIRALA
jgi:tripartite ATP-independent transporter DctP family solute receptor